MHEGKYITHIHKGIASHRAANSRPERRTMADSIIEFIKRTVIGIIAATLSIGQAHTEAAPKYTQEDVNLLAEVIYHENWHTDKDHLAAYYTGAVVMNRVRSKDWPNTIESVLYQRGQYSTTTLFYTIQLPDEVYEMAERILRDGTDDVPESVVFQAMRKQGKGTWKKVGTDYFCYG